MYKSSIIVTISNEYALTENFFDNLLLIIKDDINVFAVVDGVTDTQTVSFLQRLQEQNDNISVTFNNENLGFSKANNIGAFMSTSPYLIFLNSDTFPIGNALYQMIDFMDKSPEVGVAQGKSRLYARYSVGGKVELAIFVLFGVRRVVGGDTVDSTVSYRFGNCLNVCVGSEGRIHSVVSVTLQQLILSQSEVVRSGFACYHNAVSYCVSYKGYTFLCGNVGDMNRHFKVHSKLYLTGGNNVLAGTAHTLYAELTGNFSCIYNTAVDYVKVLTMGNNL